jgi:putative membrane protein|tara:strand:+ start:1947 stop:2207 length:261 start_codon:yes stop_codon:yes gene_type:complete
LKVELLGQGLHHTEAERCVAILADSSINNLVPDDAWHSILKPLLAQIKANNTEAGLIAAITACGDLLAEHVPSTHDQDELTNHLIT